MSSVKTNFCEMSLTCLWELSSTLSYLFQPSFHGFSSQTLFYRSKSVLGSSTTTHIFQDPRIENSLLSSAIFPDLSYSSKSNSNIISMKSFGDQPSPKCLFSLSSDDFKYIFFNSGHLVICCLLRPSILCLCAIINIFYYWLWPSWKYRSSIS